MVKARKPGGPGSAQEAKNLEAMFGRDGFDGASGKPIVKPSVRARKPPLSKEAQREDMATKPLFRRPASATLKNTPAKKAAKPDATPSTAKKFPPGRANVVVPKKTLDFEGGGAGDSRTKAAFDLSTKEGRSDFRLAIIADLDENPESPGMRDELEERATDVVAKFPLSELETFVSDLVMSVGRPSASPLLMYVAEELFKQKDPEVSPRSYSAPGPIFARG